MRCLPRLVASAGGGGRGGRGHAVWQVSRWLQQEGGRACARCLLGGLIAGARCGEVRKGQRVCVRHLPVVLGRGGRGCAVWQVSRWLQQEGGRACVRCLPGGLVAGARCGGGGVGGGRLVGSCGRKGHRACVRCLPGRLVASARCGGWHC